jgi:hypothetical protein
MAIDGRSSLGAAPPPFLTLFKSSQNPCFSLFPHPYTTHTSPPSCTRRRLEVFRRRAITGVWSPLETGVHLLGSSSSSLVVRAAHTSIWCPGSSLPSLTEPPEAHRRRGEELCRRHLPPLSVLPHPPIFPVALTRSPGRRPDVQKHQTEAATPSPASAWSPVCPSLVHVPSGAPPSPTTPW